MTHLAASSSEREARARSALGACRRCELCSPSEARSSVRKIQVTSAGATTRPWSHGLVSVLTFGSGPLMGSHTRHQMNLNHLTNVFVSRVVLCCGPSENGLVQVR